MDTGGPGGSDGTMDNAQAGARRVPLAKVQPKDRPPTLKSQGLMREKGGLRGLVPDYPNGKLDTVYEAYLKRIDPVNNEAIAEALAAAPDPRFRAFLQRAGMPSGPFAHMRPQTIAKSVGIGMLEFQKFISEAVNARAVAEAQMRALDSIKDMGVDARSIDDVCERCDALGWVAAAEGLPEPWPPGYRMVAEERRSVIDGQEFVEPAKWIRTCPKCKGATSVRKPGDAHSRDRVLEVAKLINQRGPALALQMNFGGAAHASAVGALADAMPIDISAEPVKTT